VIDLKYYARLWELLQEWMPQLLVAAGGTLQMMGLAFVVAAISGLFLALARLSRSRVLAGFALGYIEAVRGTPPLTQLFFIYFGLTGIGITFSAFQAAVIGLGLNGAAYLAEVYRAGIQAVHQGQRDAAASIGMTRAQTMRHVILPQAIGVVLPPMGNYSVSLLKETSVASIISAPELMLRARDLSSEYYMPMQLYLIVALMYLVMAFPLSRLVRYLEFRTSCGR
jgi:His/Glu/Gln/Arg/opine family amino acid ABC transporter permease subunit